MLEVVRDLGLKCISEEYNIEILKILTNKEIKDCVRSLHPLKVLRPDGYSSAFYRIYWLKVGDKVIKFI